MTRRKAVWRWAKRGLAVVAIAGATFVIPTVWFKPWSVNHYFTRAFIEFVWLSPMTCSRFHAFDFRKDQLDDFSENGRRLRREKLIRSRALLHSYDRGSLSAEEGLSYDVLDRFLADGLQKDGRFVGGVYAIDQIDGVHTALPEFMVSTHQIANERDAENYLARVLQFPRVLSEVLAVARADADRGTIPPRFILERVRVATLDLVNSTEHPLVADFDRKLGGAAISAEGAAKLRDRLGIALRDVVAPAYRTFASEIDALAKRSSDDAGLWKLPDGAAKYQAALEMQTTTAMTPDEIYALGEELIAIREAELRKLVVSLGKDPTDIGAALRALRVDATVYYQDSPEGRHAAVNDAQTMLDDMSRQIDVISSEHPRVGIEVREVPDFREKSAPAGQYFPPPADGKRPGTFWLNVGNLKQFPKYSLRTLAYHEGTPGHHLQQMIARQQPTLSMFRKMVPSNAYMEGWALYAEDLAYEKGFHKDRLDQVGYFEAQLLRAVRLVVDTGIHAKRWTRAEAVAYMQRHSGMNDIDIGIEVDRYVVWPGQACGYAVGWKRIRALRERAEKRMGSAFDLRLFHAQLLDHGALPLPQLETVVGEWIDQQPAGTH